MRASTKAVTPLEPCLNEYGNLQAKGEFAMPLPDLPDQEGQQLLTAARQEPLKLENQEALDRYLRKQKDWRRIILAWGEYISAGEHVGPVPFLRRGTAYRELGDYHNAYLDLDTACRLGNPRGCAALKGLPEKELADFAAKQKTLIEKAERCETETSDFVIGPTTVPDEFNVTEELPRGRTGGARHQLSRKELANLLSQAYADHHWSATLYYPNPVRRVGLRISFAPDGKVTTVESFDYDF